MRLVFDTDVVVAAMRSPSGASAALLLAILDGQATLLLSVPLALEYEAICLKPVHCLAAGLTSEQSQSFVTAVIAMSKPITISFHWRPLLRDPNDEMVLELAVNGHANAIVSFNHKDYGQVPNQFGLELLLPKDVLQRIR